MTEAHVNHILGAYMRASDDERMAGMSWYDSAREVAESLSPNDICMAAGVIAAMSPMTAWPENVKRATAAILGDKVSHTKPNVIKVLRILSGESPLNVLSGPKTRAFYMNIMGIAGEETVTIDRHAIDIACGIPQSDSDRVKAVKGKVGYKRVADMYLEAASIIGIPAYQLQAITWVYWRRNVTRGFYGD